MMKVRIPYGTRAIEAELPDRAVRIANEPMGKLPPAPDLRAEVRRALDAPLDLPPLREYARSGDRVVIAFDDATVAMYGPVRGVIIREVLADLDAAGVKRENILLICANSLHRKFRANELAMQIGADLVAEFGERLFCHDAEDPDNLVYLGQTPGGRDVEISRYVMESDLTIYVNAGYNRGFSGGWKSVCVGLSTYRSIKHHHTPDGMSMSIKNNSMHEMLDDMGRLLESRLPRKIFKVDTLAANPFQPSRIVAGSVWAAREECLRVLAGQMPARREITAERFDVVLYGVPNWSPYAIYSSLNPLLTLVSSGLGYLGGTVQALGKPGCSIVMVTPCPNQWDRVHHISYPDVWENVLPQTLDPHEIMHRFSEQYATHEEYINKYRFEHAFHPVHAILATYPLKRLRHAGRVFVAGIEDPAVARHVGFHPTATAEDALAQCAEIYGGDYSLAYVEQPVTPGKHIL